MKNHAHQIYRARRDALLAVDARARRRRPRARADRARSARAIAIRYFPYRHDSYFYYLSGFPEPEAVVALVAGPDGDRHVLFCREKNEEREIWDGFRYGPDAAREIFGFDEAHPIAELRREAARPRRGPARAVHAARAVRRLGPAGHRPAERSAQSRAHRRAAPDEVVDVRGALDAMRLVKDAHELDADAPRRRDLQRRRTGARWSARGPAGTSTRSRPSWCTSSCATARRRSPIRRSSRSGPNACVLHYRDNNRADERRRPAADRRRLRVPGLRVRHHAHVSGQRQVQRAAEGRLRARARLAARVHRRGEAGRRRSTTITRSPSACSRRASSTSACARARSTRCWRAAATSSSTCIAPGTGSAWTCTTPASTRSKGASQTLAPGMVLTVEPGTYIRPARQRARSVLEHRRAHRGRRARHRRRATRT